MAPSLLWRELLIASLAVGCLPPDEPAKKPAQVDADAQALVRTWIVADHILGKGSSITPAEATGFNGRTIEITPLGYVSPWQGSCEEAGRTKRTRPLIEVISELEISPSAEGEATSFGLGAKVIEFRLSCTDRKHPPPLTLFVSNNKAMTCFNGVCYLMKPF
ncbi:MAG: hypothetical protein H0T46_01145 [Deltaproteobacteria bacterium]|nr:hypothetical protein [Deltaproteobacteria bacterium]